MRRSIQRWIGGHLLAALKRSTATSVSRGRRTSLAGVTNCHVVLDETGRICGFYTLAAASILLADLPKAVAKRLPRYPSIPAVRMGRLAVDRTAQGLGLGAALLTDALALTKGSDIAAFALIVDAKDDAAAAFCEHHGFATSASVRRTLFPSLASVPVPPR